MLGVSLGGLLRWLRSEFDEPGPPDQHHGASADIVQYQSGRRPPEDGPNTAARRGSGTAVGP